MLRAKTADITDQMSSPASGDLRNVVKTIACIPTSYSNKVCVTLNDRDLDIVARNVILLLIALTCEDTAQAVDCMLHVWYSALIRGKHFDILSNHVRPLIQDVNTKIKNKAAGVVLGKTWTFGTRTLRLVLSKEDWSAILSCLEIPDGLSAEKPNDIRTAVTTAPSRIDFRERRMTALPPAHRVCANRFHEDGTLLPFGCSRDDFNTPNPFVLTCTRYLNSD